MKIHKRFDMKNPLYGMDSLAVLEKIMPELPDLVGGSWDGFKANLDKLVDDLHSGRIGRSLFNARLPELFRNHAAARQRFIKLARESVATNAI